jgi:hypothetical protein
MHHTDGPLYHDRVVILSFGFPALMSFQPRLSSEEIGCLPDRSINVLNGDNKSVSSGSGSSKKINILLQPYSLLYFSSEAYSSYMHGIDTWDDHAYAHEREEEESPHPRTHNWNDSFASYVSSLGDEVIDKKDDHPAGHAGTDEAAAAAAAAGGGGGSLQGPASENDCVRLSLTIRHMF